MNEKLIWDYLYQKIKNPYGVAALMGNLYVESKLNPKNLQNSYEGRLGMTDDEYTQAVDEGRYTDNSFIHDGAGYGLVQWTYWSRKKALLDFAHSRKASIGNLFVQLDFLWKEIQGYKTVMDAMANGTSIREISDVIAKRYERPADQSEKGLQNRANNGKIFFDTFATDAQNESKAETKVESKDQPVETKAGTKPVPMIRAKANVNIRTGNGKSYGRIGTLKAGSTVPWIASSSNEWHAFAYGAHVGWVSGEFAEVIR